ncbi:MAG: cytochrome-c oxidase, cbb3-type subunit III [Xanthomonadales bacterium]|nr:cytochrome-c oxidase, cbb3-type subunit III [Xanthomonadales bacterium]
MLNSFWNGFVIIITIGSIFACWWLLHWTKSVSDREGADEMDSTGHIWDENIRELNKPLPRWWLHLFNITIVFALVYLAIYPGLGNFGGLKDWSQEKRYQQEMARAEEMQKAVFSRFRDMEPNELIADAEARQIGGRLFATNCAMCHGSDARGAQGFPNLTDAHWQWGSSYDAVLTSITQGRRAAMPALADALGEEGLPQVVAYVRQLSGQQVDVEQAAAGEQRYQMFCVACHGPDGGGNQQLGAPGLADDYWLYGGDAATITQTLSQGRNGVMPAFENSLGEDHRRLIAAYVKGLSDS